MPKFLPKDPSAFRMNGLSFKEDQTPMKKTLNLGKLASKIKGSDSKFWDTKLGDVVENVVSKGGEIQEKFIDFKRDHGFSTSGYDSTLTKEQLEKSNSTLSEDEDIYASTDLDRYKANPISKRRKKRNKRSPNKNYKKGYYGA
tara:strand:+ start:68 stop:496 length:429 start_codon:yes stop_codon:yes gene_type:complete